MSEQLYEGDLPADILDAGIVRSVEREVIPVTFKEILDASPRAFEHLTRWVPDARECADVTVYQVMGAADGREYDIEIRRRVPVVTSFVGPPAPEPQPWWTRTELRFDPLFLIRQPPTFGMYIPPVY